MYDLIRFFEKKEYMEEFLDGNLFMNSLSHFWKLEEAPQKDVAEGVIETLHKDDFKKQHGSFISDFFGDEHIVLPIMNRSESYKYCHLLCCMLHEYDSLRHEAVRIDSRMKSIHGCGGLEVLTLCPLAETGVILGFRVGGVDQG